MALAHDVAEALVGDITPHCGVSEGDKHAREAAAIAEMRALLGRDTAAGAELEALWREYEEQTTPEAQLVKDFDKLEMILQAGTARGAARGGARRRCGSGAGQGEGCHELEMVTRAGAAGMGSGGCRVSASRPES